MNIFNDIYVGEKYALFINNRKVKCSIGNVVYFEDGSVADLKTGATHDILKKTDKRLTVTELKIGINRLNFGKKNSKPETKTWLSNQISINYPGEVIILPGEDSYIRVEENPYCYAELKPEGDIVNISTASYFEISIPFGTSNFSFSSSNISNFKYPPLRIWAPSNTELSGLFSSAAFDQLESISADCQTIVGNKISTISINSTDTVVIECAKVCKKISVKTTDEVIFPGQIECPEIYIETQDTVTFLKTVSTNSILVNTSDKVHFFYLIASAATINNQDIVKIDQGIISSLTIDTTDKVTLKMFSCNKLKINSTDKVSVLVESGETTIDIETTDKVNLNLDIAKKIKIETYDKVDVLARVYLSTPDIDTTDKSNVRTK